MPATEPARPRAAVTFAGRRYRADLTSPISIALPLTAGPPSVRAWAAPPLSLDPVRFGSGIGDVERGGAVNFATLSLTPHGTATHTESCAHLLPPTPWNTVDRVAPAGMLLARLADLPVRELGGGRGRAVDCSPLRPYPPATPALVLRALGEHHVDRDFTDTDPPYFLPADVAWLGACGVGHPVTDLPSLDRERDGGALAAHRAFWGLPDRLRARATVTELARLNQPLAAGLYLVSLNVIPVRTDASPSHPILYALSPAD